MQAMLEPEMVCRALSEVVAKEHGQPAGAVLLLESGVRSRHTPETGARERHTHPPTSDWARRSTCCASPGSVEEMA